MRAVKLNTLPKVFQFSKGQIGDLNPYWFDFKDCAFIYT